MSMVLRKTGREELVRQLEYCLTAPHESSKVVVVFRGGKRNNTVVKVEETQNGVFLYPFESGSELIAMAPLFGSRMRELSVEDLVEGLKGCSSDDVYLQWPSDDPRTVVGKVLGIVVNGELKVVLWPVPKDIERVNEEVRKICARKCRVAELGMQCGDCPKLGNCDILRDADREIEESEKRK